MKAETTIGKTSKHTQWGLDIALFLFAFFFLGGYNYEYLYKVQNCSLFIGNSIFFNETLEHSSGLLLFASRYLTQFLIYPWFGAFLLALGLVGIKQLLYLLNDKDNNWVGVYYLPSLLILLAQTIIGYTIYANFENAFVVELELGILLSCGLALGMKTIYNRFNLIGIGISAGISIFLFFAVGIFANLALLLLGATIVRNDKKAGVVNIVISIVLQLLLAHIGSTYCQNEEYVRALFSPLPDSVYTNVFTCSIIAILSCAVVLLFSTIKLNHGKFHLHINIGIATLGLLTVCLFSNHDTNFRTELKLQHLTEDHKWNEVIEEANKLENPTNITAAYRFLALNQTGRLWNEVFAFPCRLDTIKSKNIDITDYVLNPDLYFYCSLPHKAYRWEMEKWVTKGRSFDLLKKFTLYALLRDEQKLARRYIDLLKQSTFNCNWAKTYEKYIGNKAQLFIDYPSFKKVQEGEVQENIYTNNADLQMAYARYKHPSATQLDFRILLDLYYCNLKQFEADLSVARELYRKSMPSYMQEAVVLVAIQNKNQNIVREFPISAETVRKTQEFLQEFRKYASNKEEGAKQMASYKGTYCYHIAFSNYYDYKERNK